MPKRSRALTVREQQFAYHYVRCLNATQAAKLAGYSPRTAYSQAGDLLKRPVIAAAIDAALAKQVALTPDRVLQAVSGIAGGDIRDLFDERGKLRPIHRLPQHVAATIASVEVQRERSWTRGTGESRLQYHEDVIKVRRWDALRALELLMRHFGMLPRDAADQPVPVNVGVAVKIVHEYAPDSDPKALALREDTPSDDHD